MVTDRVPSDLAGCEIFSVLRPSDRERLASLFIPRSFAKDEIIFLKGDPGLSLYLIRSGRVKICAFDRDGVELVFTFLSAGDILGDIAILDGKPRSASAIAVEDTETFFLERGRFLDFLKVSPQACLGIINLLCERLRRISTQLEELSFLDVSGRIARNLVGTTKSRSNDSLKREHPSTYMISQEELATIVGASRVMVNKVLNSFVDLGLISIARKKLTVLDSVGLNRIASYDGES